VIIRKDRTRHLIEGQLLFRSSLFHATICRQQALLKENYGCVPFFLYTSIPSIQTLQTTIEGSDFYISHLTLPITNSPPIHQPHFILSLSLEILIFKFDRNFQP
jgi:hypothetical protein